MKPGLHLTTYEIMSHQILQCLFACSPNHKMTPVLIGKGLLLQGWSSKIEQTQVPGVIYILHTMYLSHQSVFTTCHAPQLYRTFRAYILHEPMLLVKSPASTLAYPMNVFVIFHLYKDYIHISSVSRPLNFNYFKNKITSIYILIRAPNPCKLPPVRTGPKVLLRRGKHRTRFSFHRGNGNRGCFVSNLRCFGGFGSRRELHLLQFYLGWFGVENLVDQKKACDQAKLLRFFLNPRLFSIKKIQFHCEFLLLYYEKVKASKWFKPCSAYV